MIRIKITVWKTIGRDSDDIKHNHIEDGWQEGEYPTPLQPSFTNQRSWKRMKWKKEFSYLIDGIVTQQLN